jgi:tetratricopeptide (TPR) repeat protein
VHRKPGGKSAPTSPDAWVLNGAYSALSLSNWNVALNLERVRGGALSLSVQGQQGADLNEKIAAAAIKTVTTPSTNLHTLIGRREETQLHIERGIALGQLADPMVFGMGNQDAASFQNRDDAARRRFRLLQAMQSFESALALAPTNNQPKVLLAQCYLSSYIYQLKKGRALLTDVIEKGPADKMQDMARIQLARSLERDDMPQALEIYKELARVTNGFEGVIVRSKIEALSEILKLPPSQDSFDSKKKKAITDLDRFVADLQKTNRTFVYFSAIHPYEALTNSAERTAKSLAFIEELKPKYAQIIPYYLLSYLRLFGEKDAVVHAAFGKMLADLKSDPSQVASPKNFFHSEWDNEVISLFEPDEELAMQALLLKESVAAAGLCEALSDRMYVAKGVYLMNHAKLPEAIDAFEKVGVRQVQMDEPEPWGCGTCPCGKCPVSAIALAERCQKLLGAPSKRPGFHIELEKGLFRSKYERPLLARDGESIWLGDSLNLQQFRLNGEKIGELKFASPKYVSDLACTPEKLYVATMGGGIIQIDKTTHAVKFLRVEEGLLSDHVCELNVIDNQLWIGYGHRTDLNSNSLDPEGRPEFGHASRGGVGFLDISSGIITNLVRPKEVPPDNPSVWSNKNNYGDWAPSLPTLVIERGSDASIYLAVYLRGLQRYEPASGKWSAVRFEAYSPVSSVQVSDDFLCVGLRAGELINVPPEHAIWIRPRGTADFKFFSKKDGLPSDDVGALLLDGKTLWAGGFGYIAEVRLDDMKVVRVISVPSREVTRILKTGENLWLSSEDRVFHVNVGI